MRRFGARVRWRGTWADPSDRPAQDAAGRSDRRALLAAVELGLQMLDALRERVALVLDGPEFVLDLGPGGDLLSETGVHVRGRVLVPLGARLLPPQPWRIDRRTLPRREALEHPDHREDDRRHEGEAEAHDGGGDRSPGPRVPDFPGLIDDRR